MSVDGAAETQRQIDGVGQSLSSLGARSGASVSQINNVSQAVTALATRTGMSVGAVQSAMRMVPAQLQDIAVSLQGGQSPLTVLMQQGSQLTGMFNNNVGAALRATATSVLGLVNPYTVAAATVAALAVAYNQGSKEADAYNRAIVMSGNVAGTSSVQLADMARAISNSVGTQADAAQALAALTGTGQVGTENLKQFGRVAIDVQRNLGRSVDETVKDFAELGKSPVQASLKLNDAYHYLTASTYAQIKALEEQGKSDEAAEMAQKAYATAFADRASEMQDNLGLIEKSWRSAKDTAIKAWDEFLGVGRKKTPQQRLTEVNAALADADKAPAFGGGENSDWAEMRRAGNSANKDALLKEREALQFQIDKDAWDSQQAAAVQKFEKDRMAWTDELGKYLSTADRMKREIARATQLGQDAGASDDEIKKVVDKIKSNYASLNNVTLTQLENQRDLQKEIMAGQASDLDTQYKLNLISQDDYLAKKRDMQVREIDLEIPIVKKQAELASGKEDKSAREKALGELQVLEQRRKNIISSAANAAKEADYARAKAIESLAGGWDRAITAEMDAVSQEVSLFGMSDQARQVAIAQIKLETDARKFIADQVKDGHALTQQEIDDLKAKVEVRKKSTAEVMNERAAIAGAQQLLQENRKFSADYIADEGFRAQRVLDIDAAKWRELIASTEQGSQAQKLLIEQFDQWYANRQMAPVLDKWKGVIDGLDSDFREGFRDMLTGGQDMWSSFAKSIANTLKTSLADALYQTFVKKYVVQVVTSLAGAISGPVAASALTGNGSGVSNAISAASSASNLYSATTGGLFSAGGTAIAGVGNLVGSSSLSAFGAGFAGNSAGMATTAAETFTSAGMAAEASAASLGASVAAALPYVGAAVAAFAILKKGFGHGATEIASQGLRGTLTADNVSGQAYQNKHQDGGWFTSDRNWTDTQSLSAELSKQLTQGLSSIEMATAGFAKSLGVQADWITSYSKSFDIVLTGDQAKDAQAITDFFSGLSDEIATKLVPNLAEFEKSGESLSATLQRLAGDFQSTDQVAQLIGKTAEQAFGAVGIESAKAREQLIELAGGVSTLTSEAQIYAQNYLTDAQRLAPVQKALDAAMASLGLSSVQTRDQFKDVVDSLDLTTEAGAREFSSLMALADAFAQVHPQVDAVAEAAAKAADESAKAAAALQGVKDAASVLLGDVDSAYSALQKVAAREKEAVQASINAHTASVTKLQNLAQALSGTLSSIQSPDQKLMARAAGQAQIRAALAIARAGGPLPDADSLKDALSAVQQDATSKFGTYNDYLRDLYQTQNDIAALGDMTDDQLTVEEKTLDALQDQLTSIDDLLSNAEQQIDILKGIDTNGLTLVEAMQALTSAIVNGKANPIVGATASINQAYQQYLGRTPDAAGLEWWQNAAANGAPISQIVDGIAGSTEANLNKLYQSVLGRAPDAEGLAFWMNAYGSTMDAAETADFLKVAQGTDEYKKLHPFAVGTNFVPEDMPAFIHQGERIIPAADNRELMNRLASPSGNSDLLASKLDKLCAAVERLEQRNSAENMAIAKSVAKSADALDAASNGDKPLAMKAIPA
ncbi:phage tail length tape measure family protein [Massilia sp. Root1485]|uniref:phage tail length tape measure family protein n=1 Tax=Massilia sp. Root1485 TaxID=1736472 RepID=UPI000700E614|nr:phage tail length tape measure family protein [Massilia sp. Root1485]KQZ34301.1 hypothetical protein ASD92_08280 [Massilia sp. Root1485]